MSVRAAISPRLLTRQQAATYCGVSIGVFNTACPVQAVALSSDKRSERYDVHQLDEWIDRLRTGEAKTSPQSWLDRI